MVALSGILTPPDLLSMVALAVPAMLLYGVSIFCVQFVEKQRAKEIAAKAEML